MRETLHIPGGEITSVAYTRSHSYAVVSQAGAAGSCLSKLRHRWPASLPVGVVGCLVGQHGPHTCFVVPVQASSSSAFPVGLGVAQ